MQGPEIIEEVDWMNQMQVHPAMIAMQLGKGMSALEKMCRYYQRPDLATLFYAELRRVRWETISDEVRERRNQKKREQRASKRLHSLAA